MRALDQPFSLGPIRLSNRLILAPLAGVSDVPFRRICQDLGAALTYVEMLNAVAVLGGGRRTREMLARHPSEPILGVQVTGSSAELVGNAIARLSDRGFDTIDINMGCPVRKIVGGGSGAAILKDLDRVQRTVELARAATPLPMTVKIRLGFCRSEINVTETASRIAAAGADMITIHGRTRDDTYADRVSLPGIRDGIAAARAANPRIVTVGNGDVMDITSAERMLAETGCDAIMISRGALGNPWIFRQILSGDPAEPDVAEWEAVVLRHVAYHEEHHGDTDLAARLIRKHLIWYASGFPNSNRLRMEIVRVTTLGAARELVREFVSGLPATLRRHATGRPRSHHDPKYEMDREADRAVAEEAG